VKAPVFPRTPLAYAVLYLFVSALWILASDEVLRLLVANDHALMAVGQTNKGILFIIVTTAVLYILLDRGQQQVATISTELQDARQLRIDILDAIADPVITVDATMRVTTVNAAVIRISGHKREAIIGRHMGNFVAPGNRKRAADALAAVMGGKDACVEIQIVMRDGSIRPYEFNGVSLRNPAGQIVGAVVSGRDISDRVAAENTMRRSFTGLTTTLRQTISVVAAMIEKRDPYLVGHQKRVTALALAIGERLDLDPHRMEGLQHAAMCHDIGKIQIPSEILSKPSKLTAAEFAMLREHANAGYEILSKVDFPWPIAKIVRQHHERLDGSGYPNGLVGEAILLEARILAVADTVEAMTSHRPYRPGLGLDAALAEIRKGRGKIYDARVADACQAVFEHDGFRFDTAPEGFQFDARPAEPHTAPPRENAAGLRAAAS